MCQHGDTVPVFANGRMRDVDRCIAPLVKALNEIGMTTAASCCGHGHRPGSIPLTDGRWIEIARNSEDWIRMERQFPLDIHGTWTKDQP